MKSVLKKSIATAFAAGLVASSFVPAAAAADIGPMGTYDFGTLLGSDSVTVSGIGLLDQNLMPVPGPFDNVFSFTQGATTGAQSYVFGFDFLHDMTVQYRATSTASPLDLPVWPGFSAPIALGPFETGNSFAFQQTVTGLTPGTTYWFELAGTATAASYTVTLAPVPEPENWAMMVAGLAVMGFVARRRLPTA